MKSTMNLIAAILQLVCLMVAASKFGMEAGFLVIAVIICNSIQAATMSKE